MISQNPDDAPGTDTQGREPMLTAATEASWLQALAHPLRLRLLGLLRLDGPSTATRLAQRSGSSPALVSYHLRKLASAGIIVEADPSDLQGKQVHGRERWWKASHSSTLTRASPDDDDAVSAAHQDFDSAVVSLYADRAKAWLNAQHLWPHKWQDVSTFGDVPLRLTAEETLSLNGEIADLLSRYRRHEPGASPGQYPDDSIIIAAQFLVFPAPEQDAPSGPQIETRA
ncbi:helix-turn-helix domain-containing protein [Arthrobacter rhombi]|uniref:helix-turn-helix domain-containing protein n=1 Tax=Arthrobacter rhombi TaxID=71253 RepID=UPI003FD2D117